eukprot:CAMPEP_0181301052 /NCGR_PEP_ID=MMETSP1101-20121128/7217_1 /TAXON_ID=46948 /ORGANISM="Rhodomonas abbreviata, Strain Caron Lab Isolate" /LENGTH=195 /DNA_ID=CAMNT_0023406329 /DNA_START=76 /DNA_END=663 /DNA_ORIENTATION=-
MSECSDNAIDLGPQSRGWSPTSSCFPLDEIQEVSSGLESKPRSALKHRTRFTKVGISLSERDVEIVGMAEDIKRSSSAPATSQDMKQNSCATNTPTDPCHNSPPASTWEPSCHDGRLHCHDRMHLAWPAGTVSNAIVDGFFFCVNKISWAILLLILSLPALSVIFLGLWMLDNKVEQFSEINREILHSSLGLPKQ